MIVCHKYKFIYVKTKKTASTSIEIALSKFCDHGDIITTLVKKDEAIRKSLGGIPGRIYTSDKKPNVKVRAHSSAAFIKEIVSDEVWNTYTKITSVRNTYDMMVSKYWWERNPGEDFNMWYSIFKKSAHCNWDIYTIDDKPAMDFYIHYENIEEDCEKLGNMLGLPQSLGALISQIKTKNTHREQQWPDASIWSLKKIARDAKKEIEFFGYDMPEKYKQILNNINKEIGSG